MASGLGSASPVVALLAITALGAIPILLVPQASIAKVTEVSRSGGSILNRSILLWFACVTAGASTVAAIEIGAVALAMKFGYEPALAILFTVPLCLASVAGSLWGSVRNRMAGAPSSSNCRNATGIIFASAVMTAVSLSRSPAQ